MSERTANELLVHLQDTHTGASRCKMVKDFLAENPGTTAAEVVEWMITSGIPQGTVEKAGRFVHGDGWKLNTPGVTAQSEMASLQRENSELRDQLRQATAKCAALTNTNLELVRRNTVLSEFDTPKKISRLEKRQPVAAE